MPQGGKPGILQRFKWRWWAFFYKRCLVGFPWFWSARPPGVLAMVAVRRVVRRHFGRDHHPVYRTLAQIIAAIVWPPAVLVQLCEIRYYCGPEAVPMRRAPGAIWAAMRHNVPPSEYYAYALWHPGRRANIDNYLYSKEAARLFKLLNRPSQPNPIDDKLAFHELCKAHAIPSPEILAAFTPTGKLLEFESGPLPEHDLFVKPRIGRASEGTERFRWQGAAFEGNRGCWLSPENLSGYLATRARSENRTLLVQPALSNHPQLRVGADTKLATARLVTGLSTDGNVTPIFGFLLLYFAAGSGAVVLIDVASGRLISPTGSCASRNQPGGGPDDACMLPSQLPDWEAALQCANAAHGACSNYAFIGWDIAFTNRGPILLEGNANWDSVAFQRLSGEPLGHTQFAEILAARINKL